MNSQIDIVRVFVASPSDVQEERDALEEVVRRVNETVAGIEAIQLRLVRWETDVEPSVGADPQAIVNEQVGDNYEVFIGILWTRFGTKTPRAESGTVEEFERALARHREDPSISVMVYFKEEPRAPLEIDPAQLGKVQEFRRQFLDMGLYGTFTDTDSFISTMQVRLTRLALAWKKGERRLLGADNSLSLPPAESDIGEDGAGDEGESVDDEAGFLDLVETGISSFEDVAMVSERMTREVSTLTKDMQTAVGDLEHAKAPSGVLNVGKARAIVDRVANNLNQFAARMSPEVSAFRRAYGNGIRSYGTAATLLSDFEGDAGSQLDRAVAITTELLSSIVEARKSVAGLQKSIHGMPRVTSRFSRARKRALAVLSALDREMSAAITSTRETLELFDELRAQGE